jgi:hypothetical protein
VPDPVTGNPFASRGAIVVGEQFVGRKRELRRLANHSLSADPGCSSITGLPKIGKSSLAWNLLFPVSGKVPDYVVPAWLSLATCGDLVHMLRRLAVEVRNGLTRVNPALRSTELDRAIHEDLDAAGVEELTRGYLTQIRAAGLRVVVAIDEFDVARSVFGDDCEGAFRILRDLAYDVRWRLAWVIVSRRSVSHIVQLSGASDSPFPNIVTHQIELGCFKPAEQDALIALGGPIAELAVGDLVQELSGGHPHLGTTLLRCVHDLVTEAQEAGETVSPSEAEVLDEISGEFVKYYDALIRLLREEETLRTLVEILFGPVFTATRYDADRLRRQGLLRETADKSGYRAFSAHFGDYLSVVAREEDLWPLWTQTERVVRDALRRVLVARLSEDWPAKLPAEAPQLANAVARWTELWLREKRRFGSLAVGDILDYTNSLDLLQIMYHFWSDFRPLLGSQPKVYWETRFQALARVRNPLAHSRPVEKKSIIEAEEYCRELLDRLTEPSPAGRRRSPGDE